MNVSAKNANIPEKQQDASDNNYKNAKRSTIGAPFFLSEDHNFGLFDEDKLIVLV